MSLHVLPRSYSLLHKVHGHAASVRAGLAALTLLHGLAACAEQGEDAVPPPGSGSADAGIDVRGPDITPADSALPDTEPVPDAEARDSGTPEVGGLPDGGVSGAERPVCDPLDPASCLFPWPSDFWLVEDPTMPTGLRLTFGEDSMPINRQGFPVDPTPFGWLDGFGPGVPVMTVLPGVDLSALPGEESLERSVETGSASLLLRWDEDSAAWARVPHWVELDATTPAGEEALTFLRPAVILEPATRHAVVFRDLRTLEGQPMPASPAFAALRDGQPLEDPWLEARRPTWEAFFESLADAGIARSSLTLAWSFTTGSEAQIQRPLREAIDLVLDAVPAEGPALSLVSRERFLEAGDDSGLPVDANVAWRASATLRTPSVLTPNTGSVGFRLLRDDAGHVQLGAPMDVNVRISVPQRALTGEPVGVVVYGHGLLGDAREIFLGHLRRAAQELGCIFVATPLRGMSADDAPGVIALTSDLTEFAIIADGLVQGIAQTHVLAESVQSSLPGLLAEIDDRIVLDPDRVFWFGGSQGGIFGATVLATSETMARGILAVPGNNYATLLQRSINFGQFFTLLRNNYGSAADIATLIALAQLQWDWTDPVSWLRRMLHEPLADGRRREALFLISKADKQVAVVTNEIAARTWPERLAMMEPWDVDRTPWGVPQTPYPHLGSGMILFDFGNPWPLGRANLPPDDPLPDPHPRIAEVDAASGLLQTFLEEGRILDVCGGDGCRPD
jgi:hypothetical protein